MRVRGIDQRVRSQHGLGRSVWRREESELADGGSQSYIDWLLRHDRHHHGRDVWLSRWPGEVEFDLTPRQSLRASLIAGRSSLREEEDNPGPNELTLGKNAVAIGNVQWRFTPSTRFAVTQQVYALKTDFDNSVVDGRVRDEGGDTDVTWRGGAEWNPKPAHFIEFGAQTQRLNATRVNRRFTANSSATFVDADVSTWSAAGWVQFRWTPTARLSIIPGVRAEHWDLIEKGAASPWLLTEYEVRPGMRLRFGAGVQHQSPTIDRRWLFFQARSLFPSDRGSSKEESGSRSGTTGECQDRSTPAVIPICCALRTAEIRIENNRLVLPQASNWQNALTGRANGIELKLERRSANGLNGWVTYAWNKYELEDARAAGQLTERFYGDYDQRHTLNTYVAYRWSSRTSLSARMRYGSNFPIRGYIGSAQPGYILSEQRNGLRLPTYARLDIRADRAFTYRKSRLTLFMELINVTNRENVRPSSPGVNIVTRRVFEPSETTFPLLPVAGVLIEF